MVALLPYSLDYMRSTYRTAVDDCGGVLYLRVGYFTSVGSLGCLGQATYLNSDRPGFPISLAVVN